ncbi:MAG: acyloxyacyl hydrolase [Deltaproteobacteria bacterium]|nr:acyloxyacyl hydrolase [Deltaproteobacteria bacterium]
MKALILALGWLIRNSSLVLIGILSSPGLPLGSEVVSPRNPQTGTAGEVRNSSKLPGTAQTAPEENRSFAAGTRNITIYPSAAAGKSGRKIYAGHVGLGYYVIDNLSINLEGVGYGIDQDNDTGAVGLDLLPRWHYMRAADWSLYLDGGAGIIYSNNRLGESGTHFNFTLQGGLGVTYHLTGNLIPITGLRWFHISNARIQGKDRNVGFDSPMFYLGLMKPF